jgi:hypothetical protein
MCAEIASVQGGRLSYRWSDNLEESNIKHSRGLEHGYTLRARPTSLTKDRCL